MYIILKKYYFTYYEYSEDVLINNYLVFIKFSYLKIIKSTIKD